jgi:hypothetical protein
MKDVADDIRREAERAGALFRTWPETEVTKDRGVGKWTRKEILGHLLDSAANNHQRFVRARLADSYAGPGYDQTAWVDVHAYRERPWLELVDLWVALNRHLAVVVESTPAASLQTPCIVGGGEAVTLEYVMKDYVRHMKNHLAQIEAG